MQLGRGQFSEKAPSAAVIIPILQETVNKISKLPGDLAGGNFDTETHRTVQNIKARGAFTVSLADAAHVVEADYFGIETGNRVTDKLGRAGLTASKAETVDAPVVNEFPVCLECEFIEYQADEYGLGVIGRVKNVTADERVMADGKIDISKINAIAFDPYTHGYYKVTERVGEAFKDGLKLKK